MSGSLLALAEMVDTLETPIRSEESARSWLLREQRILRRILKSNPRCNPRSDRVAMNPGMFAGNLD